MSARQMTTLTRRDLAVLCYLRRNPTNRGRARAAARWFATVQRLRGLGLLDQWSVTPHGHVALAAADALRMSARLVDAIEEELR